MLLASTMQRVTISLEATLGDALDGMACERQYRSRSEAIRDLVREGLDRWRLEAEVSACCVANLSYIVDRRVKALPQRLLEMQHARHDLIDAVTVVRLDHFHSLETVVLRGGTAAVRAFADAVRAERGVRFGAINLLLVHAGEEGQHDAGDHDHPPERHLSPAT